MCVQRSSALLLPWSKGEGEEGEQVAYLVLGLQGPTLWHSRFSHPLRKVVLLTSLLSDAHWYILRCLGNHGTVSHCTVLTAISEVLTHCKTMFLVMYSFKCFRILLVNIFPSTKTVMVENYRKYLWLALNFQFIFLKKSLYLFQLNCAI